jgi:hypothetical protein
MDAQAWDAVVDAATERMQAKQAAMIAQGLSGDVQYQWSLDDCTIAWSRDGAEFLRGRISLLATVAVEIEEWLWSWANPQWCSSPVCGDIELVRDYGIAHGFELLSAPSFQAEVAAVTSARIVAADLLGADGLWQEIGAEQHIHFAVYDLVNPGSAPPKAVIETS